MSGLPAVPGFALERLLGEGAYGRVYLAREAGGLARPVALKLFAPAHREAFARELEVLRRVEELRRRDRVPELVQALATGEHEEQGWIALEYLEEGSLADLVAQSGPLTWAEAAPHGAAIGRALAALHGAGLFHRDVKPANVLLGADGQARLGDFGLSRPLDGTLSAAGSPAFAAPELIAGRPSDGRRIDVYGLAATVHYLVTGETLLPGRPDVFALERRAVPRPAQAALTAALAADPAERTRDVAQLVAALEGVTTTSRTSRTERDEPLEEAAEPGLAGSAPVKDDQTPAAPPEIADLPLEVGHARCPFCREAVGPSTQAKRACSSCMAWHHAECWDEQGGCASCGVRGEGSRAKGGQPADSPPRRSRAAIASALLAVLGWAFLLPTASGVSLSAAQRREMERMELAGARVEIQARIRALEAEHAGTWALESSADPVGIKELEAHLADLAEREAELQRAERLAPPELLLVFAITGGIEVLALLLGVIALRRTRAGVARGRGLAWFGVLAAGVPLALYVLLVLVRFALSAAS